MRKAIVPGLALTLGACISGGGAPPPLPPLAEDIEQPALALFEHVLTGHFAAFGANPPTTCAKLLPGDLTAEQEQALITRFVRLAPTSRCTFPVDTNPRDTITGDPAGIVEVYSLECRTPTQCTAWVTAPGSPAARYAMLFESGRWRFTRDPRLIAE